MKFVSLEKMRITYSEQKYNLGRKGKGLITFLGLKDKSRPKRYKRDNYAIGNVIKKNLSKKILLTFLARATYLSLPLISMCFLTL